MSQELEQLGAIKQENEKLKKQNEDLENQLESIRKAAAELQKLREDAATQRIATDAYNKVLKGLGIASAVSITGFVAACYVIFNMVSNVLIEPKNIEIIAVKVADELRKPDKLNTIETKVTDGLTNKLLNDPEFRSRFSAIATKAADFAIKTVAKSDPNSEFSASVNKTINQKKYFVLAASSTDDNDLRNLLPQVANQNLKALICQPKRGNQRKALIVTNTSSKDLSLDEAKAIETKAKAIEPTAYILPTEPPDDIFFAPDTCQ
jgi:hypothetical protein